jgi:GAF domain-containing protein
VSVTLVRGTGAHTAALTGQLVLARCQSGCPSIYGAKPQAFDDDGIALAQAFAAYAAVAIANAHLHDTTATLAHHSQTAMDNRAIMEQAKAIVIGERRCTAEEAFGILVKVSQDSNRKLRDVASSLVEKAAGAQP